MANDSTLNIARSAPTAEPSGRDWATAGDDVARAVGMVMVQARCPADRALALMRARCVAGDRDLRDVAVAVIHRELRFDGRERHAVTPVTRDPVLVRAVVSLICLGGRVDQLGMSGTGTSRTGASRTGTTQAGMRTDLRAVVECLLTAHYSEQEIFDYLTGPLGVTEAEAERAWRETAGGDLGGLGEVGRSG